MIGRLLHLAAVAEWRRHNSRLSWLLCRTHDHRRGGGVAG